MDEKILGRDEAEVKEEVLKIAIPHKLISAYTSLVAVEERISGDNPVPLKPGVVPNAVASGQKPQPQSLSMNSQSLPAYRHMATAQPVPGQPIAAAANRLVPQKNWQINKAIQTNSAKKMLKTFVAITLIGTSLMNYGNAIWIKAKARLAQGLIEQAWQQTLETSEPQKPWNWADTYPIARIHHPASGADLYVFEGIEGHSLAFGAGHNQNTPLPGEGTSIIGGHRDTHFSFLREALLKDELLLQGQELDHYKHSIPADSARSLPKRLTRGIPEL